MKSIKKLEYDLHNYLYGDSNESVYLMYNNNTDLYKIGITNNINRRLSQIKTQSGCEIDLIEYFHVCIFYGLDSKSIEEELHKTYKKSRVVGEWFKFTEDEADDCYCYMSDLCEFGIIRV